MEMPLLSFLKLQRWLDFFSHYCHHDCRLLSLLLLLPLPISTRSERRQGWHEASLLLSCCRRLLVELLSFYFHFRSFPCPVRSALSTARVVRRSSSSFC